MKKGNQVRDENRVLLFDQRKYCSFEPWHKLCTALKLLLLRYVLHPYPYEPRPSRHIDTQKQEDYRCQVIRFVVIH